MSTPTSPARHMADLVRQTMPRIHPGGRAVIAGAAAATLLSRAALGAVGLRSAARVAGRVGVAATAASALFFRQPDRVPPADPSLVVAPADGVVSLLAEAPPPAEVDLGTMPRPRISIFLSVFDVHVQFAPVTGRIGAVAYHPGAFLSADLDKASEVNERNSLVITPDAGGAEVVVTQIAGLIARRIVCDVAAGDRLGAGDVYGLIRFGSRLDVYLPAGTTPAVRLGQRAVGGETVLARLSGEAG